MGQARGVSKDVKKVSEVEYDHQNNKKTGSQRKSMKIRYTKEQILAHLKRFDVNGDGRLSLKELKEALNSLGSRFPPMRAVFALRHADNNGDGYISEGELEKLVEYVYSCGYTIK